MVSLEVVKEELGITGNTQDAKLSRLIKVATKTIENYCKRNFDLTTYIEEYKGTGTRYLNLRQYPIIDIASVYVNDNTVALPNWTEITDDVFPLKDSGQLYLASGFFQREREYKITYSAGYDPDDSGDSGMPYDLQQACIDIVSHLYNKRGGEVMKSESLGDRSYTRFERTGNLIDDLGLSLTLSNYRTPTSGGI